MDLAFLHPLYEHPGPWASVYVDTSGRPQDTPRRLHLAALAAVRELSAQGADRATCWAVEDAIEEMRLGPEPPGCALFARDGGIALDARLTRPPRDGGTAAWAALPRVAPLLDLTGEDPVVIVAYVDRRGADFELRGGPAPWRPGPAAARCPALFRGSGAGWSERQFQLKVENTWEHNAAEIADALSVSQEEAGADLLVLVGDARTRREVGERLPRRLAGRVVESSHGVGGRLSDDEVEQMRAAHVRRRVAAELDRFRAARTPDADGRTGAVEGVPALVRAARDHRLEELLIRPDGPDPHREVWIGEAPDELAVRPAELPARDGRRSWPAHADDALIRSAATTDATALSPAPVSAAADEDVPLGGLGALLRDT
ncbi:baeRF2 domain-containing protein [Streptomyces tropicalis]|uniref:Vms1/Ankzf1 family peptidyl-tRNA hydrolase n=1 Tax=Streptomyces tropicalis TaxID=3034234 RepID=A0ABT6A4H1_9ACTN|nr:Vms1/Ankzf1 family peptidyl-tRNA hydrolase [Streptomyces tropicalis]MDF3298715.1 Vms1/Ankzf1 family peptidyl-tRNA hydrolase [Streptomyces tropicalis]